MACGKHLKNCCFLYSAGFLGFWVVSTSWRMLNQTAFNGDSPSAGGVASALDASLVDLRDGSDGRRKNEGCTEPS